MTNFSNARRRFFGTSGLAALASLGVVEKVNAIITQTVPSPPLTVLPPISSAALSIANFPRLPGEDEDSKRIQRGIAARLGGGVLNFPAGEYHIKQTVLLSSGVRIEGVGSATIILLKGENAHFRVHSTRNVAVVNLAFKGNGNDAIYADQSKKSESDYGPKGLLISGVNFEDCGICLGYADTEDLTILNNHLQGTNAGIFLDGCKKALITGNTVSNRKSMHRGGISLVAHKSNSGAKECPVQNVIISNNIVHDCSESGIWIASGEYITVSGNHCFRNGLAENAKPNPDGSFNGGSGIGLNNTHNDWKAKRVGITNNVCEKNNHDGIDINNGGPVRELHLIINGNACSSNVKTGIFLSYAQSGTIVGNACERNGTSGILVAHCGSFAISSNIATGNGTSGSTSKLDKGGLVLMDAHECALIGNICTISAEKSQELGISMLGNGKGNFSLGNVE